SCRGCRFDRHRQTGSAGEVSAGRGWATERGVSRLPVDVALEQVSFSWRQGFYVGDKIAVVVEVEEDLAAFAKVLDLALGPAHREAARAAGGSHGQCEMAQLGPDGVDANDGLQIVT